MQVRDLVRSLCLAGRPQAPPGRYYLSGGSVGGWAELGRALARVMGRRALVLPFPAWALGLVGQANQLRGRLSGRAAMLNPDKHHEARQPGWLCDGSRFERAFGFAPQLSIEEGLERTVRGYRTAGWL